jgi:hypothetical protein
MSMTEVDGSAVTTQVDHTLSRSLAVGVYALTESGGDRRAAGVVANVLLMRKNTEEAQANVYLLGGAGPSWVREPGVSGRKTENPHQIDDCQESIGCQKIGLTGRKADDRPCDRSERKDDKSPAGKPRTEVSSCHHSRDHCGGRGNPTSNIFQSACSNVKNQRIGNALGITWWRRGENFRASQ